MTHTPKVVETKELNDEQVSYRLRCCDDPTSDSWHTMSVLPPKDEKDDKRTHEQQLDELKVIVGDKHAAKVAWREKHAQISK